MGVTNQESINRAALSQQAGPALAGEHKDPRNDVLSSARRAEAHKHAKYDAICAGKGRSSHLSRSRRRAGTGLASSTMRALRRCTIGTSS
jgi:hypothetical protein